LEVVRLRPFTDATSRAFVKERLAENLNVPPADVDDATEAICDAVGAGVPFFLQLVMSQVADAARIDGLPLTPDTVRLVYQERVLGPDCKSRFDHYRSRLKDYYDPDDETRARLVLCYLSDGGKHEESELLAALDAHGLGDPDGEAAGRVLAQLETDYYVVRRGSAVRFLHRVLADWWRVNIRPPAPRAR